MRLAYSRNDAVCFPFPPLLGRLFFGGIGDLCRTDLFSSWLVRSVSPFPDPDVFPPPLPTPFPGAGMNSAGKPPEIFPPSNEKFGFYDEFSGRLSKKHLLFSHFEIFFLKAFLGNLLLSCRTFPLRRRLPPQDFSPLAITPFPLSEKSSFP